MEQKDKIKIFQYLPDADFDGMGHLPLPEKGDVVWIGDSRGTVVSKSFGDPKDLHKGAEHSTTRYEEVRIVVEIK